MIIECTDPLTAYSLTSAGANIGPTSITPPFTIIPARIIEEASWYNDWKYKIDIYEGSDFQPITLIGELKTFVTYYYHENLPGGGGPNEDTWIKQTFVYYELTDWMKCAIKPFFEDENGQTYTLHTFDAAGSYIPGGLGSFSISGNIIGLKYILFHSDFMKDEIIGRPATLDELIQKTINRQILYIFGAGGLAPAIASYAVIEGNDENYVILHDYGPPNIKTEKYYTGSRGLSTKLMSNYILTPPPEYFYAPNTSRYLATLVNGELIRYSTISGRSMFLGGGFPVDCTYTNRTWYVQRDTLGNDLL